MRRLLCAGACALAVLAAGCDAKAAEPADASPTGATSASAATPTGPLTVVAVGDSVTDADSPDFSAGAFGPGSWVSTADRDGVDVLGGWAVKGATTAAMAAGGRPSDAGVLLALAGSTNTLQDNPSAQFAADLHGVVPALAAAPG